MFPGMRIGILWFGCALALGAQILPDWHILELATEPAGKVRGVRAIRDSQSAARTALGVRFGARVAVRESTEIVANTLIIQGEATADELAALPGVKRVWPVTRITPALDRAALLANAPRAWEITGGSERAGLGMKIAIVDSGADTRHAGFQGTPGPMPDGFPKSSSDLFREHTNGKVIVYRSYERMQGHEETPEDRAGHGTAVAMIAAGVRNRGPRAEIQGIAPGAFLGIYKVFGGPNGENGNLGAVLRALDDAVADGMDVINISLGAEPALRPSIDPLIPAIERAASLGVTVVKAAGNSGPVRFSQSSPFVGSNGLTAGSSLTDRIFFSGLRVDGGEPVPAVSSDGSRPPNPVSAPFRDAETVDPSGLLCSRAPAGSLNGAIVLILRGTCLFEEKLNNAQIAGAVGAVVYTHAQDPAAFQMGVGAAGLPAVMVSHANGLALKQLLAEMPRRVEVSFTETLPILVTSNGIANSSSRGPGVDDGIQPDLVAVGANVYTATQKANPSGAQYDPSGYVVRSGTSFSAPVVAGAYALVKAARPGLRAERYRSLLVNNAEPFPSGDTPGPVQVFGAGRLDIAAALEGRLTLDPVSISFGAGGQQVNAERGMRVQNVSGNVGTWSVEVSSADAVKPVIEPAEFSLGPGDTADLRIRLNGSLALGEYQGHLLFRRFGAPEGERPPRAAYWYGVPSGTPASAAFLPSPPATARTGATVSVSLLVTDAIGAPVASEAPRVTLAEGSGDFLSAQSLDNQSRGYWQIQVRMGSVPNEINRFRVEIGPLVREISIRSR